MARTGASVRPTPAPTLATRATVTASPSRRLPRFINDGDDPASSDDPTMYFDWWPTKGTTEWVEMTLAAKARVSEVEVYWFDDTGHGQVRVPASWRLLYKSGDQWLPVQTSDPYGVATNRYNRVRFTPVETSGAAAGSDDAEGLVGGSAGVEGSVARGANFRVGPNFSSGTSPATRKLRVHCKIRGWAGPAAGQPSILQRTRSSGTSRTGGPNFSSGKPLTAPRELLFIPTATSNHAAVRHEKPTNIGTSDSAPPIAIRWYDSAVGSAVMPNERSTLSRPRTPPASAPKIPASENGRISARRASLGPAAYITAG